MNKHRVVGFIVVIALIVIATEFLLNYRMQSKVASVEAVQPPMPELVENTESIEIEDLKPIDTSHTNTIKIKNNAATTYAHAWVVQLASYTDQAHADSLISRLHTNGFDAFSYQAVSHGKNYIRVNAGPVATSEDAKQLMTDLKQKVDLQGFLVRYAPSDELDQQQDN